MSSYRAALMLSVLPLAFALRLHRAISGVGVKQIEGIPVHNYNAKSTLTDWILPLKSNVSEERLKISHSHGYYYDGSEQDGDDVHLPSEFVLISSGKCEDHDHMPIENEEKCASVALWLGLDNVVTKASNDANPSGCYYRSKSSVKKLWFNNNRVSVDATPQRRIICATAMATTQTTTTTWPSYKRIEHGKCVDAANLYAIKDTNECVDAARALGLDAVVKTTSSNKYPSGCYYREQSAIQKLWFNLKGFSVSASDKRRVLCATNKVVYKRILDGKCADAADLYAIDHPNTCVDAARALGLDSVIKTTSSNKYPSGCYYREESAIQKLWFNSKGFNVRASNERHVLCATERVMCRVFQNLKNIREQDPPQWCYQAGTSKSVCQGLYIRNANAKNMRCMWNETESKCNPGLSVRCPE